MSTKHSNFVKYMKMIVNHKNYITQPCRFNSNGEITWVKASGKCRELRVNWWDDKIKEYNLNSRADVARYIHPKELNGLKPCSECGKELSIFYVYPGKILLQSINDEFNQNYKIYTIDIYEIIKDLLEKRIPESDIVNFFKYRLKIKNGINSISELNNYLYNMHTHKSHKGKMFSPGVMANPPDRFDGFHTYNACCRKEKDKGRHDSNMKNYTRDRRAFEYWADGNFILANQIMAEFLKYPKLVKCPNCCKKAKMTADHIGPISLGFCHREKFNPLCSACNSAKNNRMTFNDVKSLIKDEKNGIQVISWHSKFLWDRLKDKVYSDNDAKNISSIMRENMHYILSSFNIISNFEKGYKFLLTLLHPEIIQYKYEVENFDPLNLDKIKINSSISEAKTKAKSLKRYIDISFEELHEYNRKENRIYNNRLLESYKNNFSQIKDLLICEKFIEAKKELENIFQKIALELENKFINLEKDR